MTRDKLVGIYQGYVDCLNRQDWGSLEGSICDDVTYNGSAVGIVGNRAMLERDFREYPTWSSASRF